MKTVGLITEYNPFHNGHRHHLRESLRISGAAASVAVMSGHFLQRGEPALVDKWVRTEMALAAGVDIVLELPFPFACNSAPHFALGAVRSLNALGIVDAVCFGSEAGVLPPLMQVAEVLAERESQISAETAARLRQGVNYPAARAEVLARLMPQLPAEMIASPNNVLAIEYLKALRRTASRMEPMTIPRLGPGYHSHEPCGEIASATAIRQLLADRRQVTSYLPGECRSIFTKAIEAGEFLDQERQFIALQALLLQDNGSLAETYQVEHGLDRRLADVAMIAASFAELVEAVKSRPWTLTRVQRILCYVLMRARRAEMEAFVTAGPTYLRLLGVSSKGRQCLARARKQMGLPLISDPARARKALGRFYREEPAKLVLAERMLAYDLRATRLHGLLLRVRPGPHFNRDFYRPVLN